MTIKIGHYNWEKIHTKGGYYPEDLPSDWRLAFYANEFECAELRIDAYSKQEFEDLCEDLSDDFELLIRSDSTQNCLISQQWLQSIGVHCFACREGDVKELQVKQTSIIYLNEILTLKEWRSIVEQWSNSISTEQGIMMLDAANISCQQASELRVMIEMMGL